MCSCNLRFSSHCLSNIPLNHQVINKIGIVFNLDEHWQSGSHWVALYCNLEKSQIFFFDSYGKRPEKRIRDLVKKISRWCHNKHNCKVTCSISDNSESYMRKNSKNNIEDKLNVEYNRNRHQYKNSECGVYSLNFIMGYSSLLKL